jgi:hypothetical protein
VQCNSACPLCANSGHFNLRVSRQALLAFTKI